MIHIRHAEKEEVQDLQNLNNEIFVDNAKYDSDLNMDWPLSEKGKVYFTELVHDVNALCLIVEDENKKVGYLAAREKEIEYRNSRYLEIENMGVNPEYRSKGIGKLLVQKCFEWAKEKGFKKVYVSSYAQNTKAVDFYKNNGFEGVDVGLERGL
jgi:ribosomal protein S18 acetylase RimI-like enzyme